MKFKIGNNIQTILVFFKKNNNRFIIKDTNNKLSQTKVKKIMLNTLIKELKQNKDINKCGMILTHTGIVRETTRDGKKISKLEIEPDFNVINAIVDKNKNLEGIVDIKVWMHEKGTLSIGDEIMHIAIAGDIRENTLSAMTKTLNEIKAKAVKKRQL